MLKNGDGDFYLLQALNDYPLQSKFSIDSSIEGPCSVTPQGGHQLLECWLTHDYLVYSIDLLILFFSRYNQL